MKRLLNIPIPYEYIKFKAEIYETEEMNTIQKYVSAVICTSNEGWATITLSEAIEKKLGIKKFNHFLIHKEIEDLFLNNLTKSFEIKKAFETKVGMLNLYMVENVKKNIIEKCEFHLLSKSKKTLQKEILIPLFDCFSHMKFLSEKIVKNQKEKIMFDDKGIYNNDQKIDIFYEYINDAINRNQTVKTNKKEIIDQDGKHVFVNHALEIIVENKNIKIEKIIDKKLIKLINDKKISINIDKFWNKDIENLNLKYLEKGNKINFEEIEQMKLFKHKLFDTKFNLLDDWINLYYCFKEKMNYEKQSFDLLFVNKFKIKFIDFLKKDIKNVDKDFIELMNKQMKLMFLKYVLENKIDLEQIDIQDFITFDIYKLCNNDGKHFILNNKILEIEFLNKYAYKFNETDIKEYQEITKSSFEKVIKKFEFNYSENKRLFHDWEEESNFFKAINKLKHLNYKNHNAKEIELLKNKLINSVNESFKNQKIWKDVINQLKNTNQLKTNKKKRF